MKKYFDPNNYAFNKESRNGVYIIHGFTNTTYEIKELALYLSKKGFYTVANNLPGHGTTIEECNRCKYTDWLESVEQGVADMASRCDNVYIIGISMGSVLALQAASIFPVNAAVFASTALDFKDYIGYKERSCEFIKDDATTHEFESKEYEYISIDTDENTNDSIKNLIKCNVTGKFATVEHDLYLIGKERKKQQNPKTITKQLLQTKRYYK